MNPTDAPPRVTPLSRLRSTPVPWLWPNRLALGKLAILDGDPGLGKSLITLDLGARLTTGRPFPDSSPAPAPANVLVFNAEDAVTDTLRPRLLALGADLDRCFIVEAEADGPADALSVPGRLGPLGEALRQTQAQLVVIDPITAFLDRDVNANNDQGVRRALKPLAALARRHGCAILLVRHLNKTPGLHALYRGGGSIGFVGLCRSAWLVAPDPHDPGRNVLAQVKNNLAPPQPSLAYRLPAPEGSPPTIAWLGTTDLQAADLLTPARPTPPDRPRDLARTALESFLRSGTHTSRAVWDFARDQGITQRTLRRAKEDLEVRSVRVWANGRRASYWLLKDQELPEGVAPDPQQPDLEPWLAPIRAAYPDPTPIDDL